MLEGTIILSPNCFMCALREKGVACQHYAYMYMYMYMYVVYVYLFHTAVILE